MKAGWEAIIGLEVHAQLRTQSKLFAGAPVTFAAPPNSAVTALCVGLPGTLPRLNQEAVRLAARAGLGLGCAIAETSVFARKSYFYPDLPKGYQISQHLLPLCADGTLRFELDGVEHALEIERIHVEEDAGKSIHDSLPGATVVDLNRAGIPLIEIVSRPGLRSAAAAVAALAELRLILLHLGVCDGSLEEGSMRCDANVSVRRVGETGLRTRCEIKNLNSFRALRDAIDYEIARHVEVWSAGGEVVQQTRLWDGDAERTRPMRGKEDAADYRYMPDPDLPPLRIDGETLAAWRAAMPPSLAERRRTLRDGCGLDDEQIALLLDAPTLLERLLPTLEARAAKVDARALASFLFGQLAAAMRKHERVLEDALDALPVLVAIFERWRNGDLSNRMLSEILAAGAGAEVPAPAWQHAADAAGSAVSDSDALNAAIDAVIAAHPTELADYRGGKTKVFGFFMGGVMKRLGGRADAAKLRALLEARLKQDA
jgi:aspartyl-tRNA(Asn)/glutamyl-tRNA(Gln) amidotransferase subunit B